MIQHNYAIFFPLGTFHNWTLTFYGTSGNPLAANKIVRSKIMTNSARTVSPITMTTNTPISTSTNTQLPMTKDTLIPTTSEAFPTNGKSNGRLHLFVSDKSCFIIVLELSWLTDDLID